MSRIGKLPIPIPANVTINIDPKTNEITIKGPLGELKRQVHPDIKVEIVDNNIIVKRPTDQKRHKALHGLWRALINNMVIGVTQGFTKELEVVGVGYKAEAKGQLLELGLGYSHSIVMQIPEEVKVETKTEKRSNPIITLKSIDKELLGLVAAKIRSLRKPEPYKGKGIRYVGEEIKKKAGKSASSGK